MTDNKDSRQMPNRCISCGCITEDPDDCFCEKCLNKRKVMYFFFVLIYCIIIAPVRTFLKSAELFVDYSSRWLIMLVVYFAITLALPDLTRLSPIERSVPLLRSSSIRFSSVRRLCVVECASSSIEGLYSVIRDLVNKYSASPTKA